MHFSGFLENFFKNTLGISFFLTKTKQENEFCFTISNGYIKQKGPFVF